MTKKEKLKELYETVTEVTDYIIATSFSKIELEALEDLGNEVDTLIKEINRKLNPLYK